MKKEDCQTIVNSKYRYKKLIDNTKPKKERTKIVDIYIGKNKDGLDVFTVKGEKFSRSFVPEYGQILAEKGNVILFGVQHWNNFSIKG